MSLFEQKSLLAKLMATENMIIRQAKVPTASFDVKNRVLTVPVLDNNLSKDVYDLFMGHECGHALWTPLEGMKKAKEDKVNMSVLNVVEDSRIERKIKNKYPGIKTPFINAYSILYSDNFFETEDQDINELNFIDRINLHCKIGAQLALTFSEEERELLDEVESTQTWDEVVEVTKKICELMKDQLKEQKQKPIKVKVVVHGGEPDEENDESKNQGTDVDEEVDIEIHVDGENSKGSEKSEEKDGESEEKSSDSEKSEEKDGESEENTDSSEAGNGVSRSEQEIEEQIRSFTDDAYKRHENELFSKDNSKYVYANVPKYDTSKIIDYSEFLRKCRTVSYTCNPEIFKKYRQESSKVVSYLVKEFEMRKNADQMKRASTAKTGELNMNRLFSYKFTEDIFKKITVMPQGQSHGLVMYVDWSGSMISHLENTIKQLLNLVMFCKKVNIPFEVYSFIETQEHDIAYAPPFKEGDLSFYKFGLVNLLSSRMSSSDFMTAAGLLMKMGGSEMTYSTRWKNDVPRFMYLSGTPLNEAVISAFEIVPEFQKRNRLQIVNTVFLTDGEGSTLVNIHTNEYRSPDRSFTHMVIRDPKTRCEEVYDRSKVMTQTDALIRLLKQRTNSHVIGFFVGATKDISYRMHYFFPEYQAMEEFSEREEFRETIKNKFRKENSLVVTSTGFDDYYVLRSNGLDTDDDEKLDIGEKSTTRGMVTAFSKYAGNKIASRVVLNRFIGLIS